MNTHPKSAWHVPVLLGALAFVLVYFIFHWIGIPKVKYLPVEGVWAFGSVKNTIAMGYYGQLIYGCLAFVVVALIGSISPVKRWLVDEKRESMLLVLLIIATICALTYFGVVELSKWGGK